MVKYTLDEMIEMTMQNMPEPDPDIESKLGDVRGLNFMGLRHTGGVYIMVHEPTDTILYVGVSRNLGQRIAEHKGRGKKSGSLRNKIAEDLGDAEAEKQINNEIKVHIYLSSDENNQEIYENVLIKKYNPIYNIAGKQGGRGATKGVGAIDLPVEEIKEKYLAGKSTIEIGKEYGVSYHTIGNRLKDVGVPIREVGTQSIYLPVEEIKEKYLAGKTTVDIGKEFGVSFHTIINRLKDAGVPIRDRVIDLPVKELIVCYLAGKSTYDLGREFGVSAHTINNRLKDAGVTLWRYVSKRKQLNAHIIKAFDAEQMDLYISELNKLELAGA